MSYDYEKYEEILFCLVKNMFRDPDDLEIGVNISDAPEVKIIFDGYGDLDEEEYIEGGNKNMESYAIFIHKDSAEEGFEFPEHDTSPWCLIHRPEEEVCIYAWYDVELDDWTFSSLEEVSEHKMTDDEVMCILHSLYDRYYHIKIVDFGEDNSDSKTWPFPTGGKVIE